MKVYDLGLACKGLRAGFSGPRGNALLWLAAVLVLVCFLAVAVPRVRFSSDVMEMLPGQSYQEVPKAVTDAFTAKTGRQVILAVAGPREAADDFYRRLTRIRSFKFLQGPLSSERRRESSRFLYGHRGAFLSAQTRERLAGDPARQIALTLSELYSPVSGVTAREITGDPLLLMRGSSLVERSGAQLTAEEGWVLRRDESGRAWRFINAEVKPEAVSSIHVGRFLKELEAAKKAVAEKYPEVEFAWQGAVFYSGYADNSAKYDMKRLGGISVGLLFLLLAVAFRSLLPFLLCLVSIAAGAAAGLAATILVFGQVHLLTLVMSLSLIGISADYTTHYFTARMGASPGTDSFETIRGLRPTMLQALVTTCAAYAALLFAPFPGLRQLGVFSICGLAASFLTVVLWYPWIARGFKPRPLLFEGLLTRWVGFWSGRRLLPALLLLALAAFCARGVILAGANDDIGALQNSPAELKSQEKLIASLTGRDATQRWLVVDAKTPEEALQRKDELAEGLRRLKSEGLISGATLLPLNSVKTQLADRELIQKALPPVAKRLAAAGIRVAPLPKFQPLEMEIWLRDYLSQGWGRFVMGGSNSTAILIPVHGERSPEADAALKALAESVPGTAWIDRRSGFAEVFGQVRSLITWLLTASAGVIVFCYCIRYGMRRAVSLLIPCGFAVSTGIAVLGWTGLPVNIFSLFALILVVGLGIDYALFFCNLRSRPQGTLFAVVTAMLTTVISLGILVFSGTAAIANFGLVLTAGVLAAFLTAPVCLAIDRRPVVTENS